MSDDSDPDYVPESDTTYSDDDKLKLQTLDDNFCNYEDKEEEDEEEEEEEEDEEDEEEEDEEDEEEEFDPTIIQFELFKNFLVDEEGNNIATHLGSIAHELRRMNKVLLKKEKN
jgi:hypothetical protein